MLTVESLVKSYGPAGGGLRRPSSPAGPVLAVHGVSLRVEPGEMFTLLGPSGCGKTTLLRSIAGLERPDSGRIVVAGRDLYNSGTGVNVPANQRRLGMVFQSYAVWPHLTVYGNVAFPFVAMPRHRRPARPDVRARVMRALAATELESFADRPATALSGGQQQRLALARALVNEPDLLLLDEPLSNLDAKLRDSMRYELKRLQQRVGTTAVYVTHDQVEALSMSTRIAVMNRGNLEQVGTPDEIYNQPATMFVAGFIGASNIFVGTVGATAHGSTRIDADGVSLWSESTVDAPVGAAMTAFVRPESITLSTVDPGCAVNTWRGTVVDRSFLGERVNHVVAVGPTVWNVRTSPDSAVQPQTPVHLCVPPRNVRTLASAG